MNRKSILAFFLSMNVFILCPDAVQQESEFVSALLSAKTQEERNQLLESKRDLISPELVQELIDKGNQFRIRAEFAQARISFELAKSLSDSLNDQLHAAEALDGLGVVHYMMVDFTAALENFNQSISISEAIKNQSSVARSLNHIAQVRYIQEDYDQAYSLFQKALSIGEELNDRARIAESLSGLGVVHYMRAENDKAIDYLKRSLTLREELKDEEGIASSLFRLGLVEVELRNVESAEAYLNKSSSLSEKLGDKVSISKILSALGALHFNQGNYEESLQYVKKSLKLAEELGNKFMQSWCLGTMGQTYEAFGNYRLALDYYQKALELRKQIGEKSGIPYTLNLIGNLQLNQGNYKVAREYHKKALQLSEDLKYTREIASSLILIGESYKSEGDYHKALEYYQKSVVPTEATQDRLRLARLLRDIAQVHNRLGNQKLAMETLVRSLSTSEEINDKDGSVVTLTLMSSIQYDQGDYPEALKFADRAVTLAKETGRRPNLWEALTNLSKSYNALNQPDNAIQSLEDAIQTIESLRIEVAGGEQEQQQYFQDKTTAYHLIVDYLIQKSGKEMEAFAYAERAKARALLDVLQRGRKTIRGAMSNEELNHEQSLNRTLISLNQQLQRAKLEKVPNETHLKELTAGLETARLNQEEFRAAIYASHPELKIQRGEVEIVTSQTIGEIFDDSSSAFLEYVVTPDKIFLFVITESEQNSVSTKVHTIKIKKDDLSLRIYNFQKQMETRAPGFRKEAASLYKLLVEPAAETLQSRGNLVIVPDDVLWEMPFQALISNNDHYLLEDHNISYAPSLTVFKEMRRIKRNEDTSINVFAMGNPTQQLTGMYRDSKLARLPEAEREVKEIAKLYGDSQSAFYLGQNAREDRVKNEAGRYTLLHFATHGLINNVSPMYSQIALSQSDTQEEDGLLEAWEIMNLKLSADLVVLSACETALGKVSSGEGMIGLTWALFVAGTPTTVVSQWTVDSASTTELMIQFHKNLISMRSDSSSNVSVSQALRSAALKLLKTDRYRHPFYWAPFVVIGAGF